MGIRTITLLFTASALLAGTGVLFADETPALEQLAQRASSPNGAAPELAFPEPARVPAPAALPLAGEAPPSKAALMVKTKLVQLRDSLKFLPMNLGKLEMDVFQIAYMGVPFVQNSMRSMTEDLRKHSSDSLAALEELKMLDNAGSDPCANCAEITEIENEARELTDAAKYYLLPAANKVEWAVRKSRVDVIGVEAVWQAVDISKFAGELSVNSRDISEKSRSLKTRLCPRPATGS
jgi:hypothetical protein